MTCYITDIIVPDDKKVIGILMTYNCASLVEHAYSRIPKDVFDAVICVDDASTDGTPDIVRRLGIPVFEHPHTGYGGNLSYGFRKARELGAEYMVEIHGDGQFDFSAIPPAVQKLREGCDIVLGNRFYDILQPLRDGMSLIRYFGNLTLSSVGRIGMGIRQKDLFTGTRAYSQRLVDTLDFSNNTPDYFFSFQIIAQARYCNLKFGQVNTRCNYRGEHTSMNLWKGVWEIFQTAHTVLLYWLACANIKRGIFAPLKRSSDRPTQS